MKDFEAIANRWASEVMALAKTDSGMTIAMVAQVMRVLLDKTNQPMEVRGKVCQAIATPGISTEDVVRQRQ